MEIRDILLTSLISSSVAVALISGIKELILWRLNRKAKKEDTAEDKKESRITELERSTGEQDTKISDVVYELHELESLLKDYHDMSMECNRVILQDRIKFIALQKLSQKEITFEDRRMLHAMWEIYHQKTGGNGDLTPIMEDIDNLPLKLPEDADNIARYGG